MKKKKRPLMEGVGKDKLLIEKIELESQLLVTTMLKKHPMSFEEMMKEGPALIEKAFHALREKGSIERCSNDIKHGVMDIRFRLAKKAKLK